MRNSEAPPGVFVAAKNLTGCIAFDQIDANAYRSTFRFGMVVHASIDGLGTNMLLVVDSSLSRLSWVITSHVMKVFG